MREALAGPDLLQKLACGCAGCGITPTIQTLAAKLTKSSLNLRWFPLAAQQFV